MATMPDPYAVLGVAPTATQAEIDRAYRRRQLLLHPDRTAGRSKAEQDTAAELLSAVLDAYAIIGQPRRRAMHDADAQRGEASAAPPPTRPAPPPQPQPGAGPAATGPAPSGTGAPEAARAAEHSGTSAARVLAVIGAAFFVVAPICEEVATHFLQMASYNLRWVVGFALTAAIVVLLVKWAAKSGHGSPIAVSVPHTRYGTYGFDTDRYGNGHGYGAAHDAPARARITAEEYTWRAEQDRREAAQQAHWDRVEREAARARREAERYHREQSARQEKIDNERQREYNRIHPWGHR